MKRKDIQHIKMISLLLWLSCYLISSCTKEITPLNKSDGSNGLGGEISYFNASEHILSQIKFSLTSAGTPGKSYVLIDHTADSVLNNVKLLGKDYPFFEFEHAITAPFTYYNNSLAQPWVIYQRLSADNHQIVLMDTSRHSMIKTNVKLETGKPLTVYFADSLGVFRTRIRRDTPIRNNANIGLQIGQLSPDAGPVYFTIDDKTPPGFPREMKYGDFTSFVGVANPLPDTLRINCYKVGDNTIPIARGFLPTEPGYSYSIILKGYMNGAAYLDNKNSMSITIPSNLQLFITKTH